MRTHHISGCILAAGLLALSGGTAKGGESVVLTSGFRLQADRHEVSGDRIRIYQGDGFVELAASNVSGFEVDEPAIPSANPVAPKPLGAEAAKPAVAERAASATPHELAAAAAKKYSLPESFVRSVMKAESNFRMDALSPKGAIGLMQLMQDTAKRLGVNPKDPRQNAEGGAQYLRELLAKYEKDPNQVILALAAYNAGPEAVERYHGVPPYRETREYIIRVIRDWDKKPNQ